jgi:phosphate transport system permease protein
MRTIIRRRNTAHRHPAIPDWTGPLTPSGNLRRRAAVSRLIEVGATGSAAIAIAMLGWVVYEVVRRGVSSLSFAFVTHNPVGLSGGGIANALLGTCIIVLVASLIAIPIGVLTALYLTEFAGPRSRSGAALKLALDLMQGLPTIVVGLFIYGLIVIPQHKQTGFAAAVALAIVMLPLIARSSQEVLLLVPTSLREAADALGVNRWRAVRGMILPTAAGGIATGAILAIARAAGETAPLLICNSLYNPTATQLNPFGHGVPSIPMYILFASDSSDPDAFKLAWAAALILLVSILLANAGARVLLARSRTRRAIG